MPTQDHCDGTTRTQTLRLDAEDLDGGGGCCLRELEGIVRVLGTELRALDVEDSPLLVALDLSGCCDDLRLHLTDLPRLKTLLLPGGSSGATIELSLPSSYTPVTPLVIRGPIADFGVCAPWMVQPWRLDRPIGKPPVDSLAIGPPSENPPSRNVSAHLVVGRACREERLVMNCRGISHLLIMGTRLRDLELSHASLERLEISECSNLERIRGRFQARKANISLCQNLSSVSGSGRHLDIAVVKSPRLSLEGRWLKSDVALSDCLSIHLQHPTRLKLNSLPMLMSVESRTDYELDFDSGMFGPNQLSARLAGQPGELTRVFERERPRLGDRSKLATHWMHHLAMARRSQHVPGALNALRDIATNGVDREACWLIRCQLAAQCLEPGEDLHRPAYAFRRGSSGWNWSIFNEPTMGHWLDDLSLYCLCADLPVTAPFRRTLGRLDRVLHAMLLATALAEGIRPEIRRGEFLGYLRSCLARLDPERERNSQPSPRPRRGCARWLHRHNTPWWYQFDGALKTLIEHLGTIADPMCSQRLAEVLTGHGDAMVMQKAAFDMYRADLPHWQEVLVAGLEAPGHVPAKVYRQSMQLLLADRSAVSA